MTKEEAAKMFVVAWVKDWHMRSYAVTVLGQPVNDFELIKNELFPWMLNDKFIYFLNFGKGIEIKRYCGIYLPKFGDLMFDAKDNKERLRLAPLLLKMKPAKRKDSPRPTDAKRERNKLAGESLARQLYARQTSQLNGSDWNTCK